MLGLWAFSQGGPGEWTMIGWAGSRVGAREITRLCSAKQFPEAVMNFRSGGRSHASVRLGVGDTRAGHSQGPLPGT